MGEHTLQKGAGLFRTYAGRVVTSVLIDKKAVTVLLAPGGVFLHLLYKTGT